MVRRLSAAFWFAGICIVLGQLSPSLARSNDRLTVHEWGTFTVLQDETGRPLAGVNVNEESLPRFVHRLHSGLIPHHHELSLFTGIRAKGLPVSYPLAIMRMETPVIYIYPPDGKRAGTRGEWPQKVDVSVRFRGGWISEWYPSAEVQAPGFEKRNWSIGKLTPSTVGSIHWKGLTVGGDKPTPQTESHVWLAPRNVRAPVVTSAKGESEKYLFYRGVANIRAPLRVIRHSDAGQLLVETDPSAKLAAGANFHGLWLVDIRHDGAVAYRRLPSFTVDSSAHPLEIGTVAAGFANDDYRVEHLGRLRQSMRDAIVAEGLFGDEADAMLDTWEVSYFKSAGLRLFFTLPRSWTDEVLPLQVSAAADIERVMIGRIELVTPAQRQLLQQMADGTRSTPDWLWKNLSRFAPAERSKIYQQLTSGKKSLDELDIKVPADYRAFIKLGRFREALVLDAVSTTRRYAGLQSFAKNYRLQFVSLVAQ